MWANVKKALSGSDTWFFLRDPWTENMGPYSDLLCSNTPQKIFLQFIRNPSLGQFYGLHLPRVIKSLSLPFSLNP